MITKYSQIRQYLQYIGFCGGLIALVSIVIPIQTLGFELPKFVVLAAFSMGCALVVLLRKADIISPFTASIHGRLYITFAAVLVLSLFWSVAPIASLLGSAPRFQGVLVHLLFLFLGFFAADRMSSASGRKLIITALVSANVVVVYYGILQMMHMDPLSEVWKLEAFLGRVFSTLGQPNTLGQFIVLTAPFAVLTWFKVKDRTQRLALGALIMFNVVLLLGTVSRSAMLGVFVMLLFSLPVLSNWMKGAVRKVNTEQAFALSLIIVLVTSIGLLFFAQRFALTMESGRSASSRAVIWESTVEMIAERPIGWGLETMAFTSPAFTGKDLYKYVSLTTTVDRAHNEPLHMLHALGPIGFFVYFSLIIFLMLASRSNVKRDASGLIRTTSLCILGYQTCVFFGFPSIATGAIYWIIIGMLIGLLPQTLKPFLLRGTRWINICMLALATVTFVVAVRWSQARWIHAFAQSSVVKDPSMAIALHQQGVLMFSYDRQSIIEAAEIHLLALEKADLEGREDLVQSVQILIDLLRKTTNHRDGMADLLTAWLSAVNGDRGAADAALASANTFFPTSITFHRTALHIATVLDDGVMEEEHRMGIRGLLPDGYFEEGSEMRRILQKQHSWLHQIDNNH